MAPEDEMAGLHYRCNGHELGQTLGDATHEGGACYYPHCTQKETRVFSEVEELAQGNAATGECAQLPQSCPTLCDPMDCIPQAPLFMGFSRQEYWSGLPCPCPWIFLTQGSNSGVLNCRWILYPLNHLRAQVLKAEVKCKEEGNGSDAAFT
ncbi:hypothetical protein R6Z07F_000723 [Ovis aries]